ncbi:MAG: CARDB domain-containing protein [Chitinophagales bacterium]
MGNRGRIVWNYSSYVFLAVVFLVAMMFVVGFLGNLPAYAETESASEPVVQENSSCTLTVDNNTIQLPFEITDTILDPEKPIVYITSKAERKLYAVDYTTGNTSFMTFTEMPESLELGKGDYANELYVALLVKEHSSYWYEENQSGNIAVINREDFSLVDTVNIDVDPFDIVAGRDGCLYIPSGSGQWANFDSYNRSTKQRVGRVTIRQQSYARLHPNLERVYTIDTENLGYKAYNISKGNFTDPTYPGGYEPNFPDYPLYTYFDFDPIGKYIFNGSGGIFCTTPDKENDMKYADKHIDPFLGIAFEPNCSRFYTLPKDKSAVYVYDFDSLNKVGYIQVNDQGKYAFLQGDKLILLTSDTNNTYKLQAIDLSIYVNSVSLSASPEQPQTAGTPVTLSAEVIDGTSPEYAFSVKEAGGAWEVIQEWSSISTCTWNPKIGGPFELMVEARSSEAIEGIACGYLDYLVTPGPALPGAWKVPEEITDAIIDPAEPVVYMISKTEKKLYAVNYNTGDSLITGLLDTPVNVEIGKGQYSNELYITIIDNSGWVGSARTGKIVIVDKNNFSVIDMIDISEVPFDIVSGRDGYLYLFVSLNNCEYIDSYNRSTKQRGERTYILSESIARLHPTLERIYTCESYVPKYRAYSISNGSFLEPDSGGYFPYSNYGYPLDACFEIDPAGKLMFNGSGTIVSISTEKDKDMKYFNKLEERFTGIAFDSDNLHFYTLPVNENAVYTYDYFTLEKIGSMPLNGTGKYIFKQGEKVIILENPANQGSSIQVIDVGGANKIASVTLSVDPNEPPKVGTTVTLSAVADGGLNPEYRFWLKEPGGIWKVIQEWSTTNSCCWIPQAAGTAQIRVEARSNGTTLLEAFADMEYVISPGGVLPGAWKMPQVVSDAILDPVNPVIYMTSKTEKKLYAVNYNTGDTAIIGFQEMPESLDIGKGEYSNELYIALLSQEHGKYWDEDFQTTKILVLNKDNLSLLDTIEISIDPFDIVAGRDGCIYVTPGSMDALDAYSYDRGTKQFVEKTSVFYDTRIVRLHPVLERIYTMSTGEGRDYYQAYDVSNGHFTKDYSSSFVDTDINQNSYFNIDPAGKYLFNGNGIIRETDVATVDNETNMKFVTQLADPYYGIAFESDNSRFYTLPSAENAVYMYELPGFNKMGVIPIAGKSKYIFKQGDKLVTIAEAADANSTCEVQVLDLTTFVKNISLTIAPEQPQPVGTPITLSAEAIGGSNHEYSFSVKEAAGNWEVVQNWSNANTCTWTPKMGGMATVKAEARCQGAVGSRLYVTKEYLVIPTVLPGAWKMPQEITDAFIDSTNPIVYMLSKTEKKLYALNYNNGDTVITGFQDVPQSLEPGKGEYSNEIYVAFLMRKPGLNWDYYTQTGRIMVINKEDLTPMDEIDIDNPFDMVAGRDGYLYVVPIFEHSGNLSSYNRSTKQRIVGAGIREESIARLHPTLERIYTVWTSTGYFRAYNISNGNFLDYDGYDLPWGKRYPLDTYFEIDPSGQHIFNGCGMIFATVADKNNDGRYVTSLDDPFCGIAFGSDGSRFYTISKTENVMNIYDANSFEKMGSYWLSGKGKYIFQQANKIVVLAQTSDAMGTCIIQVIDSAALINNPALTGPDLIPILSGPIQAVPGKNLKINVQIKNKGKLQDTPKTKIHIWLGNKELLVKNLPNFKGQPSITLKLTLKIPLDMGYTTDVIRVIVDPIPNENYVINNETRVPIKTVHSDLTISSITSKVSGREGQNVSLTVTIANTSIASAGKFKVRVFFGGPVGEKKISGLKPGSKVVTIKLTYPKYSHIRYGQYRVDVDADQQVIEENEENNSMLYNLRS